MTPTNARKQRPAQKEPTSIRSQDIPKALEELLPQNTVRELGEKSGFVERKRKVDAAAFLWALVLGFGISLERTLSTVKRHYEEITEIKLSYSSWYEKFTPKLVKFLKSCVELALSQMADEVNRPLGEKLKRFDDVLIQDSTIVRLHKVLAKIWPATRSRVIAAGVKVATVISVVANGIRNVSIYGERTGEVKTVHIGPWIKNRILLLDLGFFKYQLFARIMANKGFFISRLKDNGNPTIVSSLRVHRGRAIELAGKQWSEVKDLLMREVLDAEVSITFSRRKYAGRVSRDELNLRLVAIYNPEARRYHVYITNIPQDTLCAEDIAALYSARWEIEMVFKELKSRYALDVVKTTNPAIVEGLIWTAILTLLVSRRLFNLLRASVPKDKVHRYTPLLWATVFVERGHILLDAMNAVFQHDPTMEIYFERLARLWEHQALSPHVNRKRLSDGPGA